MMGLKRKPPTDNSRRVHSNGQTLYGVVTNKAGRTVQFESFAERSLLLRLDRSADVQDYLSQPDPIPYRDPSGKSYHYTPDFKVWHTDGHISLHEVTLTVRAETLQLQQRHAAAVQFCHARGWPHYLHTETTLPQGSELANLLALWGYRPRRYADPVIRRSVFTALTTGEQRLSPLAMRLSVACETAPIRVAICLYHLLWHGQISMDWQRLLFQDAVPQAETRLWLTEKAGAS
jgi:hypothetical protein